MTVIDGSNLEVKISTLHALCECQEEVTEVYFLLKLAEHSTGKVEFTSEEIREFIVKSGFNLNKERLKKGFDLLNEISLIKYNNKKFFIQDVEEDKAIIKIPAIEVKMHMSESPNKGLKKRILKDGLGFLGCGC